MEKPPSYDPVRDLMQNLPIAKLCIPFSTLCCVVIAPCCIELLPIK